MLIYIVITAVFINTCRINPYYNIYWKKELSKCKKYNLTFGQRGYESNICSEKKINQQIAEQFKRRRRIKMQSAYLQFKHPNILHTSDELSPPNFFLGSIIPKTPEMKKFFSGGVPPTVHCTMSFWHPPLHLKGQEGNDPNT